MLRLCSYVVHNNRVVFRTFKKKRKKNNLVKTMKSDTKKKTTKKKQTKFECHSHPLLMFWFLPALDPELSSVSTNNSFKNNKSF